MNRLRASKETTIVGMVLLLAAATIQARTLVTGTVQSSQQKESDPPKKGGLGGLLRGAADKLKPKTGDKTASSSGDELKGRPTIRETELAGFFEKNPQPGGGKIVQWPRVAITMLEAPAWHLKFDNTNTSELPGDGCWKFTAKIWVSESQSRDVPEFYKCSDQGVGGLRFMDQIRFKVWAGLDGPPQTGRAGTTGIQRTVGPTPPDTPLPSTVAYKRAVFHQTFSGRVVQEIVEATGMDYNSDDYRLWINLAPQLEPK